MPLRLIKKHLDQVFQHAKSNANSLYWLTIAQIVNFVSLFAVSIFLGNFVDKTTYGEYKYVISISSILYVFCISGFNIVIPKLVSKGLTNIINQAFKSTLISSLVGSLLAIIISVYYHINNNAVLAICFLIISASIPLFNSLQLYSSYLTGYKDYKRIALYGFAPDIISAISTILVSIYTPNTLALIATYFASNICIHGLMYILVLHKYPPQNTPVVNKQAEHVALNLSFMNIISAFANNIDKFLIFHFLGAESLAILTFAQAFPNQIKSVQKNIIPISISKFSEKDGSGINLKKVLPSILLTNLFIIILYLLLTDRLFSFFFPNYLASISLSRIISLSLIFIPINYLIQTYLQINSRISILYKVNFLTYTLQIIFGIIFIYKWKMLGAVIFISVAPIIQTIISYLGYRQERKLNFLQNKVVP